VAQLLHICETQLDFFVKSVHTLMHFTFFQDELNSSSTYLTEHCTTTSAVINRLLYDWPVRKNYSFSFIF